MDWNKNEIALILSCVLAIYNVHRLIKNGLMYVL